MHVDLGSRTLRTGETVSAALIEGPDLVWAERIEPMLEYKGDPWTWQNSELLRQSTGVNACFFVLHRNGVPFSNIMVVAHGGVGLLGHVFTLEADRSAGASSVLMELATQNFQQRGGQALFLGTDFDSAPWHYYRRRGFEPIAPGSGYMASYSESADTFNRTWFDATATTIEPLDWPHWPAAAPLFFTADGGTVRIAATQLLGQISTEGALLPLLRDQQLRRASSTTAPNAFVLRNRESAAVLGFASAHPDPLWPGTTIIDVFCHAAWWHEAPVLLDRLRPTGFARAVSYADAQQPAKQAALAAAGFRVCATLPKWIDGPPPDPAPLDVTILIHD